MFIVPIVYQNCRRLSMNIFVQIFAQYFHYSVRKYFHNVDRFYSKGNRKDKHFVI